MSNWSSVSTPRDFAYAWFKQKVEDSIVNNVFQKKSQFRVLALSRPEHYSGPIADGTASEQASKYWFTGRILEKNMAHYSFLESPCDVATTDSDTGKMLQYLHAKIVLSTSGEEVNFDAGDVVIASIEPGSAEVIYGLQFMKFLRIEDKDGSQPELLTEDCSAWVDLDWADAVSLGAGTNLSDPLVLGGSSGEGDWDTSVSGYKFWRYAKTFAVLDASVRPDFEAFFTELTNMGYRPIITSARRSVKHQWMLYTGKLGGYKTARPCRSDHQYGFAIDMNAYDPNGTYIRKASSHSRWQPIADVAARYNIKWYGKGDEVHFYHVNAKQVLDKLKKKCTDYYWTNYGKSFSNWPGDFPDELAYIDPPVPGIPMMDDAAAVAAATQTADPAADDAIENDNLPQETPDVGGTHS